MKFSDFAPKIFKVTFEPDLHVPSLGKIIKGTIVIGSFRKRMYMIKGISKYLGFLVFQCLTSNRHHLDLYQQTACRYVFHSVDTTRLPQNNDGNVWLIHIDLLFILITKQRQSHAYNVNIV